MFKIGLSLSVGYLLGRSHSMREGDSTPDFKTTWNSLLGEEGTIYKTLNGVYIVIKDLGKKE